MAIRNAKTPARRPYERAIQLVTLTTHTWYGGISEWIYDGAISYIVTKGPVRARLHSFL